MRKKYPNWYIWDHTRLWNSPRSVQVGSFGELWVPGNSRIIHYKSFSKSLQASLGKLSTDLEYRLEKEKQIEDLKSAFEKELGEYFREARTDQLTQLSNRRAMVEYMYRESKAINNQNQPKKYHIATIDLDFFKRVNDTWGHALWDSVLKQFTGVLIDILEQKGIKAYRTGWEEFTIIWNSDTAWSDILDAIQAAIANDQVELGDTADEVKKTKEEIKSNIIKYATLSVKRKKARMEIMNDSALNSDQKDQACERYDRENPLPTPPMKCTEGFNSIKYTASIGYTEIEISPREKIEDVLIQFNAWWKLSDGASYDAKRAWRNNIKKRTSLEGLPSEGRVRDVPIDEKTPTSDEIRSQLWFLGFTNDQIDKIFQMEV